LWEAVNAQKVSKPLKKSKLNASCLLVIDGVTHMNSDCKLEKDNDGSYFFNDERMIITCPNGKNIDESNCSGHEMIVSQKGVFGMIDDNSLCWNNGEDPKAHDCFEGLKRKENCWQSTKATERSNDKKTHSVKFCAVEK
jgi:hypothetical protein